MAVKLEASARRRRNHIADATSLALRSCDTGTMRPALPIVLLLASCSDDLAVTTDTGEPTSTTTVAEATTTTTTELPTTGAPDPGTTDESTTTTTTADPDTSSSSDSSTGAPDPVCPAIKPCQACTCSDTGWSCECPPLPPEAGFIEIGPVSFIVGAGAKAQARSSWPTRIFYSFRPADPGVDGPLFVLFNGGPGASTGTLMAFGTGPVHLDPDPVANPGSWTALGDLLYVDARGTGFSYNLAGDPSVLDTRSAAFGINNYNSYLDAADFARVILRFITAHPQLAAREVAIVGESYGGIRASILLALLLRRADYDSDGAGLYDDPALVDELDAFFAARDPDLAWTPAEAATIFSRQILVQPALGGEQRVFAGQLLDLPGSPVFALAAELGLPFTPCSEKGPACLPWQNAVDYVEKTAARSRYDLQADNTWLSSLFASEKAALSHIPILEDVLGLDPAVVPWLRADQRAGAFRMIGVGSYPADGGTISSLGELPAWDRYYIPFLAESNNAIRSALADHIGIGPDDPHFLDLFLKNLVHVDTFITAAARDIAIYAPSIAPTLASHDAIVSAVDALPNQLVVHYQPTAFPDDPEPPPPSRQIRFPAFDSSHSVALDRPVELRDALGAWLSGD